MCDNAPTKVRLSLVSLMYNEGAALHSTDYMDADMCTVRPDSM